MCQSVKLQEIIYVVVYCSKYVSLNCLCLILGSLLGVNIPLYGQKKVLKVRKKETKKLRQSFKNQDKVEKTKMKFKKKQDNVLKKAHLLFIHDSSFCWAFSIMP